MGKGIEGLTPGRIVHYQVLGYEAPPLAAVVTQVLNEDGEVGLAILDPSTCDGMVRFKRRVPHAEKPTPYRWNWIPRA